MTRGKAPVTSVTEAKVARVLGEYPPLRLRIASEQLAALLVGDFHLDFDEAVTKSLELADLLIQREKETR